METNKPSPTPTELNLQQLISETSLDFDDWTSLISHVEKSYPDDIDKICHVYYSFLSEYPLCHGYWRKYAEHKIRLCTIDKAVEVFEQAVQSATYSVGLWVDYCKFSMLVSEDPSDVRRLFQRATSFVGKDYSCHVLWDKFIEFELSQQQWSSIAHLYIDSLRFPTKKLHHYYHRFKTLVSMWKKGMQNSSDSDLETQSDSIVDGDFLICNYNISQVVSDLLDPSVGLERTNALHKYISIGEKMYKNACLLNEKIQHFEARIRRPYYHVKPLDECQLDNWHHYLDFVETQEDFDWAVKVYERCLISCASYPEFWMRYVEFVETKGGREIANFAIDRATRIFVKRVPTIHRFYARFKEKIKDIQSARSSLFYNGKETDPSFVQSVVNKANMERRVGNITEASNIYKEALRVATENGNSNALAVLYVHFSRFRYVTTNSADAARDVLLDGIKNMPGCKFLLEELINSAMMHAASKSVLVIKSVVDDTLSLPSDASQGFKNEDKQDISNLYLEFIDLCGTIEDIEKAWNRHIRMFPQTLRCSLQMQAESGKKSLIKALGKRRETNLASMEHRKSQLPENQVIQPGQSTIDLTKSSELGRSSEELTHMYSENSGPFGEESAEWRVRSHNLSCKSGNETNSQMSKEYAKENSTLKEDDTRSPNLNPLPLKNLSLDPSGGGTLGTVPSTSHNCEATEDTCMSSISRHGHELNNNGDRHSNQDPSVDSARGQTSEYDGNNHLKTAILSSPSHPMAQPHPQAQGPTISPRGWHQMSNTKRFGRDSKLGIHGHSNRRTKQRQFPPRKYPQTEKGIQMSMSRGYSSQTSSLHNQQGIQPQNQSQLAAPTSNVAIHLQNMQQANVSAGQITGQPVSYPLAQMPQHFMLSNQQNGVMQNNQAYEQMWQYYYYQQQQFLLQQQQLQQPPVQAQLQEQQLMEQQPLSQDQQLQLHQYYLQQQQLQSSAQQPQPNQIQPSQLPQHQQQQQQYTQLYPMLPNLHDHPQQQPQEHHRNHEEADPSQAVEQWEEMETIQNMESIHESHIQRSCSSYQQDQGVPSPHSADAVEPVTSGA